MKKAYESPKAEKMAFEYSDAVVASSYVGCYNETTYKNTAAEGDYCQSSQTYHWYNDKT